jgi:hypothetical protein
MRHCSGLPIDFESGFDCTAERKYTDVSGNVPVCVFPSFSHEEVQFTVGLSKHQRVKRRRTIGTDISDVIELK